MFSRVTIHQQYPHLNDLIAYSTLQLVRSHRAGAALGRQSFVPLALGPKQRCQLRCSPLCRRNIKEVPKHKWLITLLIVNPHAVLSWVILLYLTVIIIKMVSKTSFFAIDHPSRVLAMPQKGVGSVWCLSGRNWLQDPGEQILRFLHPTSYTCRDFIDELSHADVTEDRMFIHNWYHFLNFSNSSFRHMI